MNFVEVKYAVLFQIYTVHLLQYVLGTLIFLTGKLENNNYKKRVNILDKNNGSHKILATITLLRIFYSLPIDIIDISFRFSLMHKDANEHLKG